MQSLTRVIVPFFVVFALTHVCAARSAQTPALPTARPPVSASESDPNSWREFAPGGCGFSILLPGTPDRTIRPASDSDSHGFREAVTYTLKTDVTYSVTCAEIVQPLDGPAASPALLAQIINGITTKLNASLLTQSEFTLDGNLGRSAAWSLPDGRSLRGKALLAGQRLYTILVSTPDVRSAPADTSHLYEESASKFLDSFKLASPVQTPQGEVNRYIAEHPNEVLGGKAAGAPASGGGVTEGVLKGKIISKPQPAYPPIARAARAQGAVVVMVVVDEEGKVVAAQS